MSDQARTHADAAREGLRQLAHATRNIEDPTEIYPVLGELTNGFASLAQSLHQIGDFQEGPACSRAWVTGDTRAGRAASYKVAWQLHRAAEMLKYIGEAIDRAHEIEATIAYDVHDFPTVTSPSRPASDHELSL